MRNTFNFLIWSLLLVLNFYTVYNNQYDILKAFASGAAVICVIKIYKLISE